MNERLKEIRKSLGLNQSVFSKPLNISRSHLAGLENGFKNLTDRLISDVCTTYNVNKEWLIDGTGEMFQDPLADYQLSDEIEDFLRLYLDLDDETKKYIKGLMKKTITNQEKGAL